MIREAHLLARLDAIALAVHQSGYGLTLLGLGSVGQELDRLDAYSDLDFFVIAKPGFKQFFLDDLSWLETVHPIAFSFRNTADGYKFLFADGIFCETAFFEPQDLTHIPYSGARVVWQNEENSLDFPVNNNLPSPPEIPPSEEYLLGEILSNLIIGLDRFHRGEKLSAARFIQSHAVDRILELAKYIEEPQGKFGDPFDLSRRFEERYPTTAAALPDFNPGYEHTPKSAQAILAFLEQHFEINQGMKKAILSSIQIDH